MGIFKTLLIRDGADDGLAQEFELHADTGYSVDFADTRRHFASRQSDELSGGFDIALIAIAVRTASCGRGRARGASSKSVAASQRDWTVSRGSRARAVNGLPPNVKARF